MDLGRNGLQPQTVVANLVVAQSGRSPRRPGWGRSCWLVGTALLGICVAWPAGQAQKSLPDLDRAFQSATAHYETKKYAEAQKELEPLLARLPNSFEVNELMGLVYAAQGLDEKANRYLKAATRLKPNDAAAHQPGGKPGSAQKGISGGGGIQEGSGARTPELRC